MRPLGWKKWNKALLQKYPEVWLSRLHYILLLTAPVLWVVLWFGRNLPIVTDHYGRFLWPQVFFALPIFFWIRFQYLHYQTYYSAIKLYRLFLFNSLASLLITFSISLPTISLSLRVNELKASRNYRYDLSAIKLFALNSDSSNSSGAAPSRKYRDSVRATILGPAQEWYNHDSLSINAARIGQIYGIRLFEPKKRDLYPLDVYIRGLQDMSDDLSDEVDKPFLGILVSMFVLVVSLFLSVFILNLLISRQLLSFLTPLFSLFYYFILLQLVEPFLYRKENEDLMLITAFLLYMASLIIVYKSGRSKVGTNLKTVAIQSISYGLVISCLIWTFVFLAIFVAQTGLASNASNAANPAITNMLFYRGIFMLAFSYMVSVALFFFYVKWYLNYSLQPKQRA